MSERPRKSKKTATPRAAEPRVTTRVATEDVPSLVLPPGGVQVEVFDETTQQSPEPQASTSSSGQFNDELNNTEASTGQLDPATMMNMFRLMFEELQNNNSQWLQLATASRVHDHTGEDMSCKKAYEGFTGFTIKFDGNIKKTKSFISTLLDYKVTRKISDDVALNSFSNALTGEASNWWDDNRGPLTEWKDALEKFRTAFSPPRTVRNILEEARVYSPSGRNAFQVYQDLTAITAPLETKTVDNVRAALLLAKLPEKVTNAMVNSDKLTFQEIGLEGWRIQQNQSTPNISNTSKTDNSTKTDITCNYCKKKGHTEKNCRLKASKSNSGQSSKPPADSKPNLSPRDKKFPHLPMSNPAYRCTKCNNVGWGNSLCPICHPAGPSKASSSALIGGQSDLSAEERQDSHLGTLTSSSHGHRARRPSAIVECEIFGTPFSALMDTGASYCQGSARLFRLCKQNNIELTEDNESLTMANGLPIEGRRFKAKIPLIMGGRTLLTNFRVFPDIKARMLLGDEFLIDHRIVINRPLNTWYFLDNPGVEIPFCPAIGPAAELQSPIIAAAIAPDPTAEDVLLRVDEGCGLTEEERDQLNQLLVDNVDIFSMPAEPTPTIVHRIEITGQCGKYRPLPRMSPIKVQKMRDIVEDLLSRGFIAPTIADKAVCPLLVEKPDGSARLCGDFRPLNLGTKDDVFPIPRMDDLLNMGAKHKFCSLIDLQHGFWQVAIAPEDQNKTAFQTPFGLYKWIRMPFGLKNAPATFQRLMNTVLNGCINRNCLAYIDDNLVMSTTFAEHLQDLAEIFQRYREHGLGLKRKKCNFLPEVVRFLGHTISHEGIGPSVDKVEAITAVPPPTNLKKLQSFIGMANWYRRHIEDFSKIIRPLNLLTRKDAEWNFGPDCLQAFNTIKQQLAKAPILKAPDYNKPFIVRTDASKYALGAVLLQGEGEDESVIEYASRTLSDTESRYSTTERECLAVVWAITRWHFYLEGKRFKLITDHRPLKWILTTTSTNVRLSNWANKLQSFMYDVEYRKGSENYVADALSRCPEATICLLDAEDPLIMELPRYSPAELRKFQMEDPDLKPLIEKLEGEDPEELWNKGFSLQARVLHHESHHSHDYKAVFVVPKVMIPEALHLCHDGQAAGHFGVEKTLHKLRGSFYWTTMRVDTETYVAHCGKCQRYKPSNTKPIGYLGQRAPSDRWETLAIDLVGPLPMSNGFRFILTLEDLCTRWTEFFPLKKAVAIDVANKLVTEVFMRFGLPKTVISDNGQQFVSEVMANVCVILGLQHQLTPFYHPQANPVERVHRELKIRIAMHVGHKHTLWPTILPMVGFALRTAVNTSTKHTPAYLMFGRELRDVASLIYDVTPTQLKSLPSDIEPFFKHFNDALKIAKDAMEEAYQQQKRKYDMLHQEEKQFNIGDLVLVTTHFLSNAFKKVTTKLAPKRDGPYIITRKLSPLIYEVKDPSTENIKGRYHVKDLVLFKDDAHSAALQRDEFDSQPSCSQNKDVVSTETISNWTLPPIKTAQTGKTLCEVTPTPIDQIVPDINNLTKKFNSLQMFNHKTCDESNLNEPIGSYNKLDTMMSSYLQYFVSLQKSIDRIGSHQFTLRRTFTSDLRYIEVLIRAMENRQSKQFDDKVTEAMETVGQLFHHVLQRIKDLEDEVKRLRDQLTRVTPAEASTRASRPRDPRPTGPSKTPPVSLVLPSMAHHSRRSPSTTDSDDSEVAAITSIAESPPRQAALVAQPPVTPVKLHPASAGGRPMELPRPPSRKPMLLAPQEPQRPKQWSPRDSAKPVSTSSTLGEVDLTKRKSTQPKLIIPSRKKPVVSSTITSSDELIISTTPEDVTALFEKFYDDGKTSLASNAPPPSPATSNTGESVILGPGQKLTARMSTTKAAAVAHMQRYAPVAETRPVHQRRQNRWSTAVTPSSVPAVDIGQQARDLDRIQRENEDLRRRLSESGRNPPTKRSPSPKSSSSKRR